MSPLPSDAHPFDAAIALTPAGDDRFRGATSPAYGNMIGPFGGITAATALNAACLHPARLGDPVAVTVNFAGPLADGPFEVTARPARTNRSTQHWVIEILQNDQLALTATAVFAVRRETWSTTEFAPPEAPPADSLQRQPPLPRAAWTANYEKRFLRGGAPSGTRPAADDSQSVLWIRDEPPRPLDFVALCAITDAFYPRIFLRRPQWTPAGTVSMTTYFHADAATVAAQGSAHLLATARGQRFGNGYFDQTASVWGADGSVLATSHQIVYFKE